MNLRRASLVTVVVPVVLACGCGNSGDNSVSSTAQPLSGNSAENSALEQILTIEDHRLLGNATLKSYLEDSDPVLVAAAATAVGRIGDPSLEPNVSALLGAADARVRAAAATALELIGGAGTEAALLAQLGVETDATVRAALFYAIGHVGSAASLPAVTASITGNAPSSEIGAAAEALGVLVTNGVAAPTASALFNALVSLAGHLPEESAAPAAFALQALGAATAPYEAAIAATSVSSPSADARASLTDALAKIATTAALQAITTVAANDPVARVRAEAVSHLGILGAIPAGLSTLSSALNDPSPAVVVAAATAIGPLGAGAVSLAPQLDALYDAGAVAVQTAILGSLPSVDPTSATPRVTQALTAALPLKLVAVQGLFTLDTPQSLGTLTNLILDPDPRIASLAMNMLSYLPSGGVTATMKANAHTALQGSNNFEIVNGVSWMAGSFGWTDFAADLAAVYPSEAGDPKIDARINILWALGYIGSTTQLPTIELGLQDDQRLVALQASIAYQQITGVNVSSQVPLESIVHATTPSEQEVEQATQSLVILVTNRGVITIQMLSQTPLNAVNFVNLVSSGFYDGLTFPRVIPNFIAQGGDPLGDGYGASTHFVRDEFSRIPHIEGAVGLATLGKDTGSCQFFFDLTWNEQLDGDYTVFGRVNSALSTVDSIEVGDTIQQAFVIPGF